MSPAGSSSTRSSRECQVGFSGGCAQMNRRVFLQQTGISAVATLAIVDCLAPRQGLAAEPAGSRSPTCASAFSDIQDPWQFSMVLALPIDGHGTWAALHELRS